MTSIVPGLEAFHSRDRRAEDLAGMITDLIEQANSNYIGYLAAAATDNQDLVWARYHASFELEKDIDMLTAMYELANRSTRWRLSKH